MARPKAARQANSLRDDTGNRVRDWVLAHGLAYPIDVLLVGATGTGKSSTLNALFGEERARVGNGVDPETQHLSSQRLHEYLRIHDSAGLGDGAEADRRHARNIASKLREEVVVHGRSYGLIDMVIVLLDGGSRDLGTAYHLLEEVVLKQITPDRVAVAINQADMAMKGRHWNTDTRTPAPELRGFWREQAASVARRIKESTGLVIRPPVHYSALHDYNIDGLMQHILLHLPAARRVSHPATWPAAE